MQKSMYIGTRGSSAGEDNVRISLWPDHPVHMFGLHGALEFHLIVQSSRRLWEYFA
jgi:hypothetical protein